ncbi:MAG: hypothetical protein IAX22_06560 [Candidatus Bathyarchaeota archaeon]|nr:hypothetical protein [Candidatus Bathyarchaeota archaeon]
MLFAKILKIRNYTLLAKIQTMKKLDVRSSGTSSRIPNTPLHVTFLDYDNIDDQRLKEELRFLQLEFELGNFYVLQTREYGRHAICIDALPFKDIKEIIDFTSCDMMFKRAPKINEYRCWVLRYSNKGNREPPKYLYTIESQFEGKNLQSCGHAKFLQKYGIKIDVKKPYGTEEIELQDYNTGKRTTKEENKENN